MLDKTASCHDPIKSSVIIIIGIVNGVVLVIVISIIGVPAATFVSRPCLSAPMPPPVTNLYPLHTSRAEATPFPSATGHALPDLSLIHI